MDEGVDEVSYYKDDDVEIYQDPSWFTSGSSGKAVTPWGLRSLMSWIKSHYPGVDVYITENGVSDKVNFKINYPFYLLAFYFSWVTLMTCKEFTTTSITQMNY